MHTKKRQLVRRNQRGSAILESAFVFLALMLMLVGIFDFGQFLFIHQALVERARSAVRWGAVTDPANTAAIQNMVLYNQPTTPGGQAAGYFNLAAGNVQVSELGAGTDNRRLLIRIVNYSYPTVSPFFSGSRTTPEIRVSYSLGIFN